ncbi:MAG: hypothetical protein ACRD29_00035 [Acidimicrobiales bacterium]
MSEATAATCWCRPVAGGRYRWVDRPIQPLPPWLADLLRDRATGPTAGVLTPVRHATRWAGAALVREVMAVRRAPEGCRNHALNRAAFALGQLVGGGHLDADTVTQALAAAALSVGLGAGETRATIASGLRAGAAYPRRHTAG